MIILETIKTLKMMGYFKTAIKFFTIAQIDGFGDKKIAQIRHYKKTKKTGGTRWISLRWN